MEKVKLAEVRIEQLKSLQQNLKIEITRMQREIAVLNCKYFFMSCSKVPWFYTRFLTLHNIRHYITFRRSRWNAGENLWNDHQTSLVPLINIPLSYTAHWIFIWFVSLINSWFTLFFHWNFERLVIFEFLRTRLALNKLFSILWGQ